VRRALLHFDRETKEREESNLRFHYHVHTSLDVIEEKVGSQRKSAVSVNGELYLGILFSVEDYKVYGYQTNTKIRFVIILQGATGEPNIKNWLRELHNIFVTTMSNPFCILNSKIESKSFEENLLKHLKNYSGK